MLHYNKEIIPRKLRLTESNILYYRIINNERYGKKYSTIEWSPILGKFQPLRKNQSTRYLGLFKKLVTVQFVDKNIFVEQDIHDKNKLNVITKSYSDNNCKSKTEYIVPIPPSFLWNKQEIKDIGTNTFEASPSIEKATMWQRGWEKICDIMTIVSVFSRIVIAIPPVIAAFVAILHFLFNK